MNRILRKLSRSLYYAFRTDHVRYKQLILPESRLRTGGKEFKSDDYLVQSAHQEARRLEKHFQLSAQSNVLDVGCGFGRLAIGLLDINSDANYVGVDVNPEAIDWCNRHISEEHKQFEFVHLDVRNARYNPDGTIIDKDFQLPFPDDHFNITYLYSVFSHMVQEDIEIYLQELGRVMMNDGYLFFTAFAESDVPVMTINPENYRGIQWKSELHCVRYNRDHLEKMLHAHGFQAYLFEYEQETDGQSGIYARFTK